MFPEKKVWSIDDCQMQIYQPAHGPGRFFINGRIMSLGSPLGALGVNYTDEGRARPAISPMPLTAAEKGCFESKLTEALDFSMTHYPDLAALLIRHSLEPSVDVRNSAMRWMKPKSSDYGEKWRAAFRAAVRTPVQDVYPFVSGDEKAQSRIVALGFHPVPLEQWQMEILQDAGAYVCIKTAVEFDPGNVVDEPFRQSPGFQVLSKCVQQLMPNQKTAISVVPQSRFISRVLGHNGHITMTLPERCAKCLIGQCICWVRSILVQSIQAHHAKADLDHVFKVYDRFVAESIEKNQTGLTVKAALPEIEASSAQDQEQQQTASANTEQVSTGESKQTGNGECTKERCRAAKESLDECLQIFDVFNERALGAVNMQVEAVEKMLIGKGLRTAPLVESSEANDANNNGDGPAQRRPKRLAEGMMLV